MNDDIAKPTDHGFTYEVYLYVSIPLTWATLLKQAGENHYDHRCNFEAQRGVINGLYNCASPPSCPKRVSWSDLDLVTKVAEQLECHTQDHLLIRAIRRWLRETKDAIEHQRQLCVELPGSQGASDDA